MKNRLATPVFVVVIAIVLAVVFNPSPQQHRAHIKAAIANRNPIAGLLGIGALTAFTSAYHSIGVASYTEVDGHIVSYGAFGFVVVT